MTKLKKDKSLKKREIKGKIKKQKKKIKFNKWKLRNHVLLEKNSTSKTYNTLYNEKYIDLLSIYIDNLIRTYSVKMILKIVFFSVSLIILFGSVLLFGFISIKALNVLNGLNNSQQDLSTVIGYVSTVAASLTSVVVALIKIPTTIAKYLFNQEEDKQMTEIIKNTQKYEVRLTKTDIDASKRVAGKKNQESQVVEPDEELEKLPQNANKKDFVDSVIKKKSNTSNN